MSHAIVIGSGISGPLAAIGLAQVGVSATVFEAYPESGGLAAGAWLTVAVNGLSAMRTLGVHEAVMSCGFPSETIELFSGTGKRLGAVPIGGRLADGSVTHTMKRSDLYRALVHAAAERGVRIEYEKRLRDVVELDDGVVARFEDGSEHRGDFLIGADGVRSRVRRLIDPKAPGPRYVGLGNVGAYAPPGSVPLAAGTYAMVFGKRAFFGYTVAPSGEVWWFANPPSAHELEHEELERLDVRAHLLELFADDQGPMVDLIAATPGSLALSNQYDLDRVPVWHRERMLLVGDAAHAASPSSGQGVSMAAEDAVALSLCVREQGDVQAALAAFVAVRRSRAERVVAYGRRFSSAKAAGPVGRFMRDLTLPLVFRMMAKKTSKSPQAWLFDHRVEARSNPASP